MATATRSIGGVLKILKEEFPDVTISKIRFLEGEGLITPERAPSGYRRYAEADVVRLRYILDVQKNHYLPLKVIREHLDAIDVGQEPPSLTTVATPVPEEPVAPDALVAAPAVRVATPKRALRLTRKDLLQMSGVSESTLAELEQHGLVVPRRGTVYFGREALTIAVVARKLAPFGMDARHLRAIKQAAERESALIEQAVSSRMRRGTSSRQPLQDVTALVLHAHKALLHSAVLK